MIYRFSRYYLIDVLGALFLVLGLNLALSRLSLTECTRFLDTFQSVGNGCHLLEEGRVAGMSCATRLVGHSSVQYNGGHHVLYKGHPKS